MNHRALPCWTENLARGIRRFGVAALLTLIVAVGAASCASTSSAVPSGPAPDEVSVAALWQSLQADLMDGRSHSAEKRARDLLVLQEARCRQLRSELVASDGDTSSALDTSRLARCEDDLREYRTLARLSDIAPSGQR